MQRFLPFALLTILTIGCCWAQDGTGSPAKGSVSGMVVNSVTGQPLSGAHVMLRGRVFSSSGRVEPQSTQTGMDGHFTFTGVVPGNYVVLSSQAGYVSGDRRGPRSHVPVSVASGQHVDNVVLSLLPGGVIIGHVFDEARHPLSDVSVQAMKVSYGRGSRELQVAAESSTSKSGEYRIGGLTPGKYYLHANYSNPSAGKSSSNKAYVPLCYPSTSDPSACVELTVQGGDELAGMDFEFAPVATVHIRGRIVDTRNSAAAASSEVTILRDQGGGALMHLRETTADAKGNFEFQALPPGSYVIAAQRTRSAQQKPISGTKTVEVHDVNIDNIQVDVGPGVDLNGRLDVDATSGVDLSAMFAILEPMQDPALTALLPEVDNAQVRPDGSFIFHDVPTGNYRLTISAVPPGFYLKGAGENDVLQNGVSVSPGHAPPRLELAMSSGGAQVEGTVMNEDNPYPGAAVILIPESGHNVATDYKRSVTDRSGRFVLRGIAPGDYQIFAWEEIEGTPFADPDFLQQYQDRGKSLHLEDGGRAKVELEVIPPGGM